MLGSKVTKKKARSTRNSFVASAKEMKVEDTTKSEFGKFGIQESEFQAQSIDLSPHTVMSACGSYIYHISIIDYL